MHTTVISTETLAAHLGDAHWVVVDCRFTLTATEAGRAAYAQSHIPGARYAHLDEHLSGQKSGCNGRHPLPNVVDFAKQLGEWGIDAQSQVVVYDDSFGAIAVRLWWLLRWLGHESVALLDGGLAKWLREGRAMTNELPKINPTTFTPHIQQDMLVGVDEVAAAIQDAERVILDARAEMRFIGEQEPLDPVAGHIPGAKNLPFDDNLAMDGTLMASADLRDLYSEVLNNKRPEQLIHMCGSGVTACHNILAMEMAGLSGSKLYAGSWSEWIADPSRPVAKGY